MAKNARFFDNVHGEPIKITLRDGEARHHTRGGQTDEGWSYTTCVWSFENGVVTCETHTRSLDCDGRFDHSCVIDCPEDNLHLGSIDSDFQNVVYPQWRAVKRSQRDHSAEAMGY